MKIIIKLILMTGLAVTTLVNAQTKAPDEVVTKKDINNCFKHIKKTEDFLYPQSLKVESAHYTLDGSKILLTLNISEKTEYGGAAGVQEKQCVIDKKVQQEKAPKKATESAGGSYSY